MCQVGSETNNQTKPNKPHTTTTPTKKKQPTNQNKNTIKKNIKTNQPNKNTKKPRIVYPAKTISGRRFLMYFLVTSNYLCPAANAIGILNQPGAGQLQNTTNYETNPVA